MYESPLTALVLSGGGARAAYQVGVLKAIARLRRERLGPRNCRMSTPFGVIVGTSAGAINAAALACQADRFDAAVEVLSRVWSDFSAGDVYRADAWVRVRTAGAPWLTVLSLGRAVLRWRRAQAASLLDNTPLAALLGRLVPLERLPMLLAQRQLHGIAITASRYGTGEHVTFYDSATPVAPWTRSGRVAVPARIRPEHLLASSAIPFLFPPMRIDADGGAFGWYGDGSMRQTAPLSAAIHLGAQRLLIIGAGRVHGPRTERRPDDTPPTLAQIAGHAMASIFLDALTVDIERMQRINRTLALLPDGARNDTPLRPLESLVISPSQSIDDIAARHADRLPPEVRRLLRGNAGADADVKAPRGGAAMASYLLFEAPFTRELIALGEADTLARRDEVQQFFAWQRRRPVASAPAWVDTRLDIVLP